MRAILLLLLSFAITGCEKKPVVSHNPYYDKVFRSTVGIYPNRHLMSAWKEPGSGTGVLLDTGFIITSKHVIDTNYDGFIDQFERVVNVQFFYPEHKRVVGNVVFDPVGSWKVNNDFAFIAIKDPPRSTVSFMKVEDYKNILPGHRLFTVGLSFGTSPPHITRGIKSTNVRKTLDRASLSIYFGNSGGGIYSEETGEMVGIASRVEVDYSPSKYELVPEWAEYESIASIRSVTDTYGMSFLVEKPESFVSMHGFAMLASLGLIWIIVGVLYLLSRVRTVKK